MYSEKILFIDDEPNVLNGIRRHLRDAGGAHFLVGGEAALAFLKENQDVRVIISDMRMPGMDGLTLLSLAKEIVPHAVCVLLTGNADQCSAIKAINEGGIFRWISKPYDPVELRDTLNAALTQYNVLASERDILQRTLGGCVKLLTEIQSAGDPDATQVIQRARDISQRLASILRYPQPWELELAVSLADIGVRLLPVEIQQKLSSGARLTDREHELSRHVPEMGAELLALIPRFQRIAEILRYQAKNFDGSGAPSSSIAGEEIPLGSRILKIVKAITSMKGGLTLKNLRELRERPSVYDAQMIDRLISALVVEDSAARDNVPPSYAIRARQLTVGQKLLDDLVLADGRVLLRKETVLSSTTVQKLKNYHSLVGIREPILVDAIIPGGVIETQGAL